MLLPLRFPMLFTGLRSGARAVLLHGAPGERPPLRGHVPHLPVNQEHRPAQENEVLSDEQSHQWCLAGTGKTTLVGKLAAEADLPLLMLAPSTVLSKWAGASERMLKKVCSRILPDMPLQRNLS